MVSTNIQAIKEFASDVATDPSIIDRSLVEAIERNGMRLMLYDGEDAIALV